MLAAGASQSVTERAVETFRLCVLAMADGSASLPLPEVAAPGAVVLPPIAALGAAGAGHPDAAAGAMAAKAGGGIERKRRTSFRVVSAAPIWLGGNVYLIAVAAMKW